MSSNEKKYDDLTVIKGIGKVRQAWFRDVFKVVTLQDLADLSIDEIESRLKDEGRIFSQNEVEQWLLQAKKLAPAETPNQAEESPATLDDNKSSLPDEAEQWEWLKAFVVEFCVLKSAVEVKKQEIRVYPLKIGKGGDWLDNGGSKKTPVKFTERDMLWTWFLEQLDEEIWQKPKKVAPIEPKPVKDLSGKPPQIDLPTIDSMPAINISQILAYQPPDINTPAIIGEVGQPFIGSVRGDIPFALEVAFAFSESLTDELARLIGYKAEFFVRKMSTDKRAILGETTLDVLFSNKLSYTARLPRTFLKSGNYHLGALVKLRSQPPKVKHLELPMFQVV